MVFSPVTDHLVIEPPFEHVTTGYISITSLLALVQRLWPIPPSFKDEETNPSCQSANTFSAGEYCRTFSFPYSPPFKRYSLPEYSLVLFRRQCRFGDACINQHPAGQQGSARGPATGMSSGGGFGSASLSLFFLSKVSVY
jgi:hypothetical protein